MELDADFIASCKQSVALEQRMAKQAGKQLNEAMRNNNQDSNVLDRIADQLFDTMSGLSGAGERTYMKYIKYLETFNPQAAKETKDAYEDIMGYKIHVAYAAARLAKELHKGQVNQAGKDYLEEHLSTVGRNGFDWKEKTVGLTNNIQIYRLYRGIMGKIAHVRTERQKRSSPWICNVKGNTKYKTSESGVARNLMISKLPVHDKSFTTGKCLPLR